VNEPDHPEERLARLERRLKQMEYNLRIADAHIAALENSIIFRILRRVGRPALDTKARAAEWLRNSPFRKLYSRSSPDPASSYKSWVEQESDEPLPALVRTPRFSILMRAVSPRREWLEEAIASVRAQSYPDWELCISYDSRFAPWLSDYMAAAGQSDKRIHTVPAPENSGFSAGLNQAATLSFSDYLLILHDSDRLAPNALHWLAAAQPGEILYADEDCLDDAGQRTRPTFKPDWSPDLLLACMYLGRMMTVSRSAWVQAGGLRSEHDGAYDYDLALRITDRPVTVSHVPRVLYHGRCPDAPGEPGSAAGRRALEDALSRRGAATTVESGPRPSTYQLRWKPSGSTLASLIVCSRSPRLLDQCLGSVNARTAYPNRETIVVQHLGAEDARIKKVIERHSARRVPYRGPFHFARMNNLAARTASDGVLVFLNDDTEPLDDSWLDRIVGQLERPEIGIVGARLLYPSGTIQHAGIAVGIGDGCGHIGRGAFHARFWPWLELTRDVAAVTGACLAIRAGLFRELGGFADEFPANYNDTDLCLRVREAGYRVIYDAGIVLRHYEGKTRPGTVTLQERENWYLRWAGIIEAGDPFYSPHLTRAGEDLSLR